eukprot:1180633-Prorocentrum_minimum.AAC.2
MPDGTVTPTLSYTSLSPLLHLSYTSRTPLLHLSHTLGHVLGARRSGARTVRGSALLGPPSSPPSCGGSARGAGGTTTTWPCSCSTHRTRPFGRSSRRPQTPSSARRSSSSRSTTSRSPPSPTASLCPGVRPPSCSTTSHSPPSPTASLCPGVRPPSVTLSTERVLLPFSAPLLIINYPIPPSKTLTLGTADRGPRGCFVSARRLTFGHFGLVRRLTFGHFGSVRRLTFGHFVWAQRVVHSLDAVWRGERAPVQPLPGGDGHPGAARVGGAVGATRGRRLHGGGLQ